MRFRALFWRPEAVDMLVHVIDCATLRELLGGCPGVWWAAVPKGASGEAVPREDLGRAAAKVGCGE